MSDALGSIIGAVGNYITAKETSDANQAINKKNISWQAQSQVQNQQWQEYMRSTAYQATMADMKKAGLNPMLAFSKGPTSWGSAGAAPGSSLGAVAPDIAGGLERGVRAVTSARAAPLERAILTEQADNLRAQREQVEANTRQVNLQTALLPGLTAAQVAAGHGTGAAGQGSGALSTQQARIIQQHGTPGPFWHPQVWSQLGQRAASWLGSILNSAVEANRALGPLGNPRVPPTPNSGRSTRDAFTIGPDAPRR